MVNNKLPSATSAPGPNRPTSRPLMVSVTSTTINGPGISESPATIAEFCQTSVRNRMLPNTPPPKAVAYSSIAR